MSEEDALVDEFFSEVNDKYYPQVLEGIDMLEGGDLGEGIEILSRPLHTIKGVTGFMSGFEYASGFTHKVEDFLKKVQAGSVEQSSENITLLSRAVNMIFQVVEQIRDEGVPDEEEPNEILGKIDEASGSGPQDEALAFDGVDTEEKQGVLVLRVKDARVHLAPQRDLLTSAIMQADPGSSILLDLSRVLTFNSAAWETIAAYSEAFKIAVFGMCPACKTTFYSWGMDDRVAVHPDEESYFTNAAPGTENN
ncbi:histidine kinase [Pseudodesulfovibrio senegalensis]|jgi:chemotaxis protein histidine kinase CheA|uniref:Histidine kinase n=1 Tax=Pseudodesulfovibrio senegalensis TaxID=1721087 RepID=A0A6N6N3K1_9BACT|nr:histidine kinase [Pseudodesulfovibrio senegalensis]KAB1442292.1 histidine kinase [Pseudodesulfovibrio senegalensis]